MFTNSEAPYSFFIVVSKLELVGPLIRKSRSYESPVFCHVDRGTKKAGLQRIRLEQMHRKEQREETES